MTDAPETPTRVEFRLLGPLAITADGKAVPLPGRRERALLALLLLSPGRTVTANTLIDRLWGEAPACRPVERAAAAGVEAASRAGRNGRGRRPGRRRLPGGRRTRVCRRGSVHLAV